MRLSDKILSSVRETVIEEIKNLKKKKKKFSIESHHNGTDNLCVKYYQICTSGKKHEDDNPTMVLLCYHTLLTYKFHSLQILII